jgi:hypothetical protein
MNKNDNTNGKNSFFVFINKILPNSGINMYKFLETTMIQLYDKYKD